MNKLSHKLLSLLFLVVFLSLVVNLFRQIAAYRRINRRLVEEQGVLRTLEEKNSELKRRLEEIKAEGFSQDKAKVGLDTGGEARSLFSVPEKSNKAGFATANLKKWWRLFFY